MRADRWPGRVRRGAVAGAVVAVALLVSATAAAGASGPPMQSTGSSFAGVAIESWTSEAGILYGTNINFQVSSSVTGMSFFAQNQVDLGASDIPYSSGQSPYNPSIPYQYLPDVAGGLALMYNLTGNDGQRITSLDLNAQAVADIFLGRIQYWDDPAVASENPQLAGDLPHVAITPVYRSDGAGENYLLSDYLLHTAGSTFVAAQTAFGLTATGPSAIGSPSASWPVPACQATGGCRPGQLPGYPGWTTGTGLEGASGADISATDVASASADGAISYVETAYAKEHSFPVANLANASGAFVQPTSVNVATGLEKAVLHADLTQDLTGVYSNPIPNAYPLSAYSYFVAPCSPSLAAAQNIASCAADPNGAPSTFSAAKGAELGQFVNYVACAGQQSMASIGYSPLPPNLVQEDFWAIGRLNGGQQPPAPTAANCKNPYVDGQIPLPGEPVIQGVAPPPAATSSTNAAPSASGAGSGTGPGTATAGSAAAGTGGAGGSSPAAVSAACASLARTDPALAARECTASGTLQPGVALVDGQIVRTLDPAGKGFRAIALAAAARSVLGFRTAELVGWLALAAAVLAAPPLVARHRRRTRAEGRTAPHA